MPEGFQIVEFSVHVGLVGSAVVAQFADNNSVVSFVDAFDDYGEPSPSNQEIEVS